MFTDYQFLGRSLNFETSPITVTINFSGTKSSCLILFYWHLIIWPNLLSARRVYPLGTSISLRRMALQIAGDSMCHVGSGEIPCPKIFSLTEKPIKVCWCRYPICTKHINLIIYHQILYACIYIYIWYIYMIYIWYIYMIYIYMIYMIYIYDIYIYISIIHVLTTFQNFVPNDSPF